MPLILALDVLQSGMQPQKLDRDSGKPAQILPNGRMRIQKTKQILSDRDILCTAEGAHGADGFL